MIVKIIIKLFKTQMKEMLLIHTKHFLPFAPAQTPVKADNLRFSLLQKIQGRVHVRNPAVHYSRGQCTQPAANSCLDVLTSMIRWKLWFVLLLPFCTDNKVLQELLMKTISKQPDVTQICTNETLNVIMLIVCKIHTESSRGEECQLLYQHGQDFIHECDFRFTLMKENQTVFLHLINLTAEDSGNYTCECVQHEGTYKLLLNVTVEEGDKVDTNSSFFFVVIGVPAVIIIISAVSLGLIYSKKCHRRERLPKSSLENTELYTHTEYRAIQRLHAHKEWALYNVQNQQVNYLFKCLKRDYTH
ncbi:uncharacterized protein LOC115797122 isoform X2 [Archocentrus centrarchus]|uniref:uncharacterized protein LOC115797122 isoform X2 n=1 Tax=Archocentrus centrarchus TaxID=63155 RepID=UPI0011EA2840|nr:uncharacterized protein LOC115797122 isoform X2 [Archocentrus centrarchus]